MIMPARFNSTSAPSAGGYAAGGNIPQHQECEATVQRLIAQQDASAKTIEALRAENARLRRFVESVAASGRDSDLAVEAIMFMETWTVMA